MQTRRLGRSNLEVSALRLGCMGMSWSLWLSIAVKSLEQVGASFAERISYKTLVRSMRASPRWAGPTDQAMHEGKGRAASREFGKMKALVGHGEAAHLLQRIEGKKDRLLNDLMKNDNRRK